MNKPEAIAARLGAAFASRDVGALGALLDPNVRWGGAEDTPQTCHSRSDVLARLADLAACGAEVDVLEVAHGTESVLLSLRVKRPVRDGYARERTAYQVLALRDGLVVDIRGYPNRAEAAAQAGIAAGAERPRMQARQVIPILNVSDLTASFDWFERLGWTRKWAWCAADHMPTFGAVESGGLEIFLSLNGQGGRGRAGGIGGGGQGVWLSIWVDDVDAVHATCRREGLEVIRAPQDEPWGVREMHVRHPDGHVFRISQPRHAH